MTDNTSAAAIGTAVGRDLHRLDSAVKALEASLGDEARAFLADAGDPAAVATWAAIASTIKSRVADLENALATELGKTKGRHIGTLADGSRYEVQRSADRKAWDHDDWKRDVRRRITETVTEHYAVGIESDDVAAVYDTTTGVSVTLGHVVQQALTMAQAVHGSANPKSTELRRYDLAVSDYCDSTPGPWRVSFIKPDTTPKTTTAKD